MPTVRKLSLEEVRSFENRGKSTRKIIEEQYDEFFRDYNAGDYGEAELEEGEKRLTVRNRLRAAAQRRNLNIEFKRTRGDVLRFKVQERSNGAASRRPASQNGRGGKRKKA